MKAKRSGSFGGSQGAWLGFVGLLSLKQKLLKIVDTANEKESS